MPKYCIIIYLCICMCACKHVNTKNFFQNRVEKEAHYAPVNNEKFINKQMNYAIMYSMVDSLYRTDKNKNFWSTYFYYAAHELIAYMKEQNVVALQYCDSAIAWIDGNYMESQKPNDYAQMLLQKGRNYLALGNIPQAYEWHYKASEFIEKYQSACNRAGFIHSLAGVLYTQGSYKLALEKYKEELLAAKTCPSEAEYMHYGREQELMDNIGLCYWQLQQYDSAATYFEQALTTIEKYKYYACDSVACLQRYATNKGVVLGNYAKVDIANNEFSAAEKKYAEAIYLNTNLGNEKLDAQLCMQQLGKLLVQQNKLPQAKKWLDALQKSLDTLPNIQALKGWNETMALYYQKQGNASNEIEYYKNFVAIKDSVEQSSKTLKQTSLLSQLEIKKKQVQLANLEAKNKQTNKQLIWVFVGLLAIAIMASIIYWVYIKTKKNNKVLVQLNQIIQQQNSRNEETMQLLQQSNAQKDNILKVVAHDLRNPISGMAAILQTIMEGDMDEERKMKMIEVAKNTSTLSMNLIDELLQKDEAANNKLMLSTTPLNQLINESVALVANKANEKQQVIHFSYQQEYLLQIDKEKIQRVILNLLNNAIKFSYQNSKIEIVITQQNKFILIAIKDTGIGIEEEALKLLFTKNSNKTKGTAKEESYGYGLPICNQIIEQHKGKIWAESEVGKGSIFYVQLSV